MSLSPCRQMNAGEQPYDRKIQIGDMYLGHMIIHLSSTVSSCHTPAVND